MYQFFRQLPSWSRPCLLQQLQTKTRNQNINNYIKLVVHDLIWPSTLAVTWCHIDVSGSLCNEQNQVLTNDRILYQNPCHKGHIRLPDNNDHWFANLNIHDHPIWEISWIYFEFRVFTSSGSMGRHWHSGDAKTIISQNTSFGDIIRNIPEHKP